MGNSAPRLKDIAEKTGFSVNTVSLALRNSPRIPEATRQVIKAAAKEMGYLPNIIAQSLVSQRTMSVGLILTDVTNPVLTQVAQAIEAGLAKAGYSLIFATSRKDGAEEKRVIEMLRGRRADAILVFPAVHGDVSHLEELRARGYPVVSLVGSAGAAIDAVAMDDRAGARAAVQQLIALGHKRIGLIDGATQHGNSEKRDGYGDALRAAGLVEEPGLIFAPDGSGAAGGYGAMAALAGANAGADMPSALFAVTDGLALGALRWCLEQGLSVPGDISIMGCDNTEFAAYASCAVSTVNYDVASVAEAAVARVLALIEAETLPAPTQELFTPDIILRESTAPPKGT